MEYIPTKTDTGKELKKPKHEKKISVLSLITYSKKKLYFINVLI
jgi:hypothetical protein